MKSGKGRAKKQRAQSAQADGDSRAHFLEVLGAGTVGAAALDAMLVSKAFGADSIVQELPPAATLAYASLSAANSPHPEMIPHLESALNNVGLTRDDARTKVYQIAGSSGKQRTVTVVPFHSTNKSLENVGSLAISDNGQPSSVSVKISGTTIVSFTTHDIINGALVERTLRRAN